MSPASPVFHTEVTVSIGLKTSSEGVSHHAMPTPMLNLGTRRDTNIIPDQST